MPGRYWLFFLIPSQGTYVIDPMGVAYSGNALDAHLHCLRSMLLYPPLYIGRAMALTKLSVSLMNWGGSTV